MISAADNTGRDKALTLINEYLVYCMKCYYDNIWRWRFDVFLKHVLKCDEFSSEFDQKLKFTTLRPKKTQQNIGIMLVIINFSYNANNNFFRIAY